MLHGPDPINNVYLTGAGRLLPGVEARVVKFDGTFARHGEPGELEVRCPNMALGYLDNEEAYVKPSLCIHFPG